MANEQNLMPIQEVNSRRSREQHSADSRKGGIASGEARRRNKTMRDCLEILLSLDVKDKKARSKMKFLGLEDEEMTNQMALQIAMFSEALKGNVQAYKELRDTVGDKPQDNVKVEGTINTNNPFADLSTEELRKAIEKLTKDDNNTE